MKLIVLSMRPFKDFFMAPFFHAAQNEGADVIYIGVTDNIQIVHLGEKRDVSLPRAAFSDLAGVIRDFTKEKEACWVWDSMAGGGVHLLLLLKAIAPKSPFVYDVFDNYLYDQNGLKKIFSKIKDRFKYLFCDYTIVHSEELRRLYPQHFKIENASSLKFIEKKELAIDNIVSIASFDRRYDYSFMHELTHVMPSTHFHLYGWNKFSNKIIELELNKLNSLKNVHYYGAYSQADLQHILDAFSIGIVPYRVDPLLTKFINPDKIYHYLCAGLEVISTPIPQAIRMHSYIHIADTPQGFRNLIEELGKGQTTRKNNSSVAFENSWEQRYKLVDELFQWHKGNGY